MQEKFEKIVCYGENDESMRKNVDEWHIYNLGHMLVDICEIW